MKNNCRLCIEGCGFDVVSNHKGFDIATSRILKYVNGYVDRNIDKTVERVFWITGHSRGAAIANILGARIEDTGYKTFTYGFATPNTTTSTDAGKYKSIFNIVNSDDFAPELPATACNFTKYGRTASISIRNKHKVEWQKLTGIDEYKSDSNLQKIVNSMAAVVANRNDCYIYTCSCHGDGSNNITIRNYGTSKTSRESAIAKIPTNALPYCTITRYDRNAVQGWDFTVCQTPAYFMQLLAATSAKAISGTRFAAELEIASRYKNAKTKLAFSEFMGLQKHPHYKESYYLLSDKVGTSSEYIGAGEHASR